MRIRARLLSVALGLLLLAPAALAADYYFVGATDSDWNDAANWSATSGGAGGAGVPGSADVAIFDANSPSCTLDMAPTVTGLKLEAGYTGALDANGQALVIDYAAGAGLLSVAGGELKLGTATHTVKGGLSYTGGTITAQTSKVIFYAPNAASINVNGDFTLNNVKFTHSNSGSSHKTVNLSGVLTVNGLLELDGYNVGGWHCYLNGGGELVAKGDISGDGNVIRGTADLTVAGNSGDQTQTSLWWGATGTYTVNKPAGTLVWAGTAKFGDSTTSANCALAVLLNSAVDATTNTPSVWLCGYGHGDVTLQGSLTAYDLKLFRPGGTGHTTYDFGGGTVTVENSLTLDVTASGGWHVYVNNGTLEAKGDVTFANNNTEWWGSALIRMNGLANATLTGGGLATKALPIQIAKHGGATVTLETDIAVTNPEQGYIEVYSGVLDLAGHNVNVSDRLAIVGTLKLTGVETVSGEVVLNTDASSVVFYDASVVATITDLAHVFYNLRLGAGKMHRFAATERITVKGFLGSDGTLDSKALLRSTAEGTAWELDAQGTARLLCVDVKDSDASPGNQIMAYSSSDSGNNTNWSFGNPPLHTWIGLGSNSSWSTAANWSQDSVPGNAHIAFFDGTSTRNCVLDANIHVTGMKLEPAYTGTVDTASWSMTIDYASGDGILSVAGGELKLGSATHTIKGNVSYTGGTITPGTGKVQICAPDGASISLDGDLGLNDVRFYHSGIGSSHKTVNLNGTLTVNGDLELEGYGSGGWHMYLNGGGTLLAKGDVTGNGCVIRGTANLTLDGASGDQTQTNLWWGATGAYTANKTAGSVIWAGTEKFGDSTTSGGCALTLALNSAVDATTNTPSVWLCGYGHGDVTVQGSLTAYDLKFYRPGGTGHTTYNLSGGTVTVSNTLTMDMVATGGWKVYGQNGTLDCKGNIVTTNNQVTDWSGMAFVLSGAAAQDVSLQGLGIKSMAVENSSATVSLSSGFSAVDSIGALAGASVVFANSQTFSCAKLALNGTTASPITLRSDSTGTAWNLNVSERYQTASCVDVKDSNAGGGQLVYAVESTDSGNNTNWSFLPRIKVNITTANGSATSPAWVQGEIGPNVTEVMVKVNSGTAFDAVRPSRMRFFADNAAIPLGITLSATSATQVDVTAKDEMANEDTATQSINWTATDLTGSTSSTVIKIRKGDSLLLTATDSEGGGTTLEMDADGDDTYDCSGAPEDQFPHQYNTAGTFVAKAKIDDVVVGSVTVVVISVDLKGPIACEVGFQREKHVLVEPVTEAGNTVFSGEFSASDPNLEFEASLKESLVDGAMLYLKPLKRGTPIIYARLRVDGPVIASRVVDEFTLDIPAAAHTTTFLAEGGASIGVSRITIRPHIPNIRFSFNMFGSESTFAGGATSFTVNTSDAESSIGEAGFQQESDEETGETVSVFAYALEIPDAEDQYCFNVAVDQSSSASFKVSEKHGVNGNRCVLDVNEVSIVPGSFKHLKIRVEKVGTPAVTHTFTVKSPLTITPDPQEPKLNCGVKDTTVMFRVNANAAPYGKYHVYVGEDTPEKEVITVAKVVVEKVAAIQKGDTRGVLVELGAGISTTLKLSRTGGTAGNATFDDDSQTKTLTSTSHVFVNGTEKTQPAGGANVKLAAEVDAAEVDSTTFEVKDDAPTAFTDVAISLVPGTAKASGTQFAAMIDDTVLNMKTVLLLYPSKPIKYTPSVRIEAPSDAKAAEYEVGVVQAVLGMKREVTYAKNSQINTSVPVLPRRDGKSQTSDKYHELFVSTEQGVYHVFSKSEQTVALSFADIPTHAMNAHFTEHHLVLGDQTAQEQEVRRCEWLETFRTWVVARHKPSGRTKILHYIEWNLDFDVDITANGRGGWDMTPKPKHSILDVTKDDGEGGSAPRFLYGSVTNDLWVEEIKK